MKKRRRLVIAAAVVLVCSAVFGRWQWNKSREWASLTEKIAALPSGVTAEELERDGFLSLRPREGREVSLFLTAQGQELVREKVLPIMAAERAAAGGLTEEELRDMIRLSQKWLSLFRKAAASLPKP